MLPIVILIHVCIVCMVPTSIILYYRQFVCVLICAGGSIESLRCWTQTTREGEFVVIPD